MKKIIAIILAIVLLLGIAPCALADTGAPIKRAAFLEKIAELGGISPRLYENTFEDVKSSDSFADLLEGAVHQHIVSDGENFRPNDYITREEAVGMVVRALRSACVALDEDMEMMFFRDWWDVSSKERQFVQIAFANYLIDIDEMFYPKRNATEDYCAALLERAAEVKELLPVHVGDGSMDDDINIVRDALKKKNNDEAQELYDEAMARFVMNNSDSEVERGYELIGMARGLIYDKRTSFLTGSYWYDNNGGLIQAHGGGILYDEANKTYYWYGEARETSDVPENLQRYASWGWRIGVSCYSSKDLYNWKYEGLALEMIEGDNLEYPLSDIRVGEVLERPKVIYNEKTGKYVMWMHIDNGWYGYSRAGVAVSDSPTGPFEYIESYRPANKMSRDMTVFADDNGDAYLYFSTDENGCLACVKLSDDYLSCTDELNYCIWWKWREAPAVFKYDDTYYMITSGCTGWDANAADYATAPTPTGPWTQHGNPCVGDGADKTFGGQSAWVLPIDSEKGRFIFIADIWRPDRHSESGYIWLPIQINSDGAIRIEWVDEWNLRDLGYNVDTKQLDKTIVFGKEKITMPISTIVTVRGEKKRTPIIWSSDNFTADMPGHYAVEGTLPEMNNAPVYAEIRALPENIIYFASCGGSESGDFAEIKAKGINNSVPDKAFGEDSVTRLNWGYIADHSSGVRTDSNMYYSVRYDYSEGGRESIGTGLTYKFEVNNKKKYNVYVGICDPWQTEGRVVDVSINGETAMYNTYESPSAFCVTNVQPEDGYITISSVRNEASLAAELDPIISWIMISLGDGGESIVSGKRETEAVESTVSIDPSKTFVLTNSESGNVLAEKNGKLVSAKRQGTANEYWRICRQSDGYYTVKSSLSGMCIGVNGDELSLMESSNSDDLRFNITWSRGGFNLSPKKHGGFIDEAFSGLTISNEGYGRTCEWTLSEGEATEEAETTVYRTIRSVKTGKAISCKPFGMYASDGSDNQMWSFKKTYFGSYIISAKTDKVSIDVPNGRTDDGLAMVVYNTIENVNQRWFLEKDENGYYLLHSEASDLYLTVENGVLVQRERDEAADQSFIITVK